MALRTSSLINATVDHAQTLVQASQDHRHLILYAFSPKSSTVLFLQAMQAFRCSGTATTGTTNYSYTRRHTVLLSPSKAILKAAQLFNSRCIVAQNPGKASEAVDIIEAQGHISPKQKQKISTYSIEIA